MNTYFMKNGYVWPCFVTTKQLIRSYNVYFARSKSAIFDGLGGLKVPPIMAEFFYSPFCRFLRLKVHPQTHGEDCTVLQDGQFAALKRKGILLENFMILSNFKPNKSPFWLFLLEKLSKIHTIGDFGCKNHQNQCCKLTILQHCED